MSDADCNFTGRIYSVLSSGYLEDTDLAWLQAIDDIPINPAANLSSSRHSHRSNSSSSLDLTFSHNDEELSEKIGAIKASTVLEDDRFKCGTVHKIWGMIQLEASVAQNVPITTQIDFVVVIDHSYSMRQDKKLAFVQATIEYLISQLNEHHRFCLIQFNQEVQRVTQGLLTMNAENKKTILSLLQDIKPAGDTNISDALFDAISLLKDRPQQEQHIISSVMLFTDGLANKGLRGKKFKQKLSETKFPPGVTIHTFGYGQDHDSRLLQNISFCSKGGVYYYIETVESIPATFGECLAAILSTVANNVNIRLVGLDGCRIINFYTKYPITELQEVKDYNISLGSMYNQESKTILFKLSLRKMDSEIQSQPLLRILISYVNVLKENDQKIIEYAVSVPRPAVVHPSPIPAGLDVQINRYTAASTIEEAIAKASMNDFNGARKLIREAIDSIKKSVSARASESAQYCSDLISDLLECERGMQDTGAFATGIHYAYAYSTMYYLERSTGTANLTGISSSSSKESESPSSTRDRRHVGYGYITDAQEEEANKAREVTKRYLAGYM